MPVAVTENVCDAPAHSVADVGWVVIAGEVFIVITALPVLPAAFAEQLASVSVLIVYVVVNDGDTETRIGLVAPLKDVPSDNVPFHGLVPVTAILKVVLCPVQIPVLPDIVPFRLLPYHKNRHLLLIQMQWYMLMMWRLKCLRLLYAIDKLRLYLMQ